MGIFLFYVLCRGVFRGFVVLIVHISVFEGERFCVLNVTMLVCAEAAGFCVGCVEGRFVCMCERLVLKI